MARKVTRYMELSEIVAKGFTEHEEKWGKLKTGDRFTIVLDDDVVHVKAGEFINDMLSASVTIIHPIRINASLQLDGVRNKTEEELEKRHMPYTKYLRTDHWKEFRAHALMEHGEVCKDCGAVDARLDVHHLTYENLWEEELEDVVVLCHSCHWARHPEKRRLTCTHENKEKSYWESGGELIFHWSCKDCNAILDEREPDEKEKIKAEKVVAKHVIWLEKEAIKRAIREARDKETKARRKEKEKLKPKKRKRRKPYKKRVAKVVEFRCL